MRKSLLLLIIFISFFYLSQVSIATISYIDPNLQEVCKSRPNGLSLCSDCGRNCDYTKVFDSPCKASDCPSGTVFVECPSFNFPITLGGYNLNCINLQCGDAGIPSGNTCIQQNSLNSSCVNTVSKNYYYSYNTGWLSCDCQMIQAVAVPQYNKKLDGTACGAGGTCQSGVCRSPSVNTQCPDGTLENACCATPGTRCKNDGTGALACQNDATCPLCTDTDGGKDPKVKGTCKDVSGGVCDWRKGGCTDTCASNGAVNEYYCPSASSACMPAIMPCSSSDVCSYGVCTSTPGGGCKNLTNSSV